MTVKKILIQGKYTNKDGTITKGGLLVAIINENIYTREGWATR
ncbi:TPA: hypothetical protein ACJEX7_001071 [Campylobacter jejuni]|nr:MULTISPECIES: hypothetical protein [Campylobacter]